jgi:hypothetical protein
MTLWYSPKSSQNGETGAEQTSNAFETKVEAPLDLADLQEPAGDVHLPWHIKSINPQGILEHSAAQQLSSLGVLCSILPAGPALVSCWGEIREFT